ncbi:hypothetical protein BJ742DRAFT_553888 [Cladochytrium replicatum]|nr:hypothetical protein BJ742DRAFT_553888 [Cladochytrium replicatum]
MTGWSYCAIKLGDFSTALKLAHTAAGNNVDVRSVLSMLSNEQTMSDSDSGSDNGECDTLHTPDGWENIPDFRQSDALDYTRFLARLYAVHALLSLNNSEEALDEVTRLESDVFAELMSHRGQRNFSRRHTLAQFAHAAALCIDSATKFDGDPIGVGDENRPSFIESLGKAEEIIGEAISREGSRDRLGGVEILDGIISRYPSSLRTWIHIAKGEETLAAKALMNLRSLNS